MHAPGSAPEPACPPRRGVRAVDRQRFAGVGVLSTAAFCSRSRADRTGASRREISMSTVRASRSVARCEIMSRGWSASDPRGGDQSAPDRAAASPRCPDHPVACHSAGTRNSLERRPPSGRAGSVGHGCRSPHVQWRVSCSSTAISRRPSTMWRGCMFGVITPNRSFGATMRLSASTSGRRMSCDPFDGHVQRVEIDDEHAVVRIGGLIERLPLRVRIAPLALRQARFDAHELEVLDLLRLAVFEDLEVVGRQSFDDPAVALRVGIDGDEHGPRPECRRTLILRRATAPT